MRSVLLRLIFVGFVTAGLGAQTTDISSDHLARADEDPGNWLMYSGQYHSQRFSRLDQITRANVSQLKLQWVRQLPTLGQVQTTPLVVDGVMYLTTPENEVYALDAATGNVFWTYQHDLADTLTLCCSKQSRGVAILGDRVYMTTLDALRLRYTDGEATTPTRWDETEPVRVAGYEAAEIGIVGSTAPRELWLEPYLSLNRQDVQLTLPRIDSTTRAPAAPFLGHRPSTWRPAERKDILVDDLDPGFTVETDEAENGVRLAGGLATFFTGVPDMDQGLPEASGFTGPPAVWSRREQSSSWGKYRHTITLVGQGAGDTRAVFTADIPDSGRWRLAYHLPILSGRTITSSPGPGLQANAQVGLAGSLGTYDLAVIAGGEEHPLEFDGAAAEARWNVLGELDLQAGEAKVVVSDLSSGRLVIADAARWEQVSEGR